MFDKSSTEYRQGWHDCYMAVLKSITCSSEAKLGKNEMVFALMDDVRSADK